MTELSEYDLTAQYPLFDGDFTTKLAKYHLIAELDKSLVGASLYLKTIASLKLVMDFMSIIRKMVFDRINLT
jgi:hypothetical protein